MHDTALTSQVYKASPCDALPQLADASRICFTLRLIRVGLDSHMAGPRLVLKLAPALLDEMRKIANVPRHPSNPYGWLTPTIGCLEMMQCLVQAVPLSARKATNTKVAYQYA